MLIKNIKIEKSIAQICQSLKEARLKRNISQLQISRQIKTSVKTISRLENKKMNVSYYYFFAYIYFLHFNSNVIELIEDRYSDIVFEICSYKRIVTSDPVLKFMTDVISRIILVREQCKISKEIISDRTGLEINQIEKIENIEKNLSLLLFLSYCNSLNILDIITESLSYKHDEIGNNLIMQEIRRSGRKYVRPSNSNKC